MTKANRSVSLFTLTSLVTVVFVSPMTEAAEHVVRIVTDYETPRMAFVPTVLKIEPGDIVIWVNEAAEEHDVVTFPDGYPQGAEALQSPVMTQAGERFSYRFDIPGTYEYHCVPHLPMGMRGVIVVGEPSTADTFNQPSTAEIDAYRNLLLEWFDEEDILMLKRQDRMRDTGFDLSADS